MLTGMTTPDLRCEPSLPRLRRRTCGCGLVDGATACAACGRAEVAAPVGGVSAQRYQLAPAPVDTYEVELGAGPSLSATFRLWSENLSPLAALGFVPYSVMVPVAAAGAFAFLAVSPIGNWLPSAWSDGMWPLAIAGSTIAAVLYCLLCVAATGGAIHLVNEKTQGVTVSALGALFAAVRHAGWLMLGWLTVSIVFSLGLAGVLAPLGVIVFLDSDAIGAALLLPGAALSALAVYVCARLTPMLPIIVVEDRDVLSAMARSWHLSRGRAGKIALAALVFCLSYGGISTATSFIAVVPVLGVFIQIALNAVMLPLTWVFPFVIYAGCMREASLQSPERESSRHERSAVDRGPARRVFEQAHAADGL